MDKNNKKTALILGAGPSGLALAYELIKTNSNIKPILLDKLDCVGGLSRTVYWDDLGVDIGGHRLFTKDKYIQSIWDSFLQHQNAPSLDDIYANRKIKYPKKGLNPNESDNVMLIRQRYSSIIYNSKFFQYPLKFTFSTLKKLGFKTAVLSALSYFKSVLIKREEKNLEDFFINRFGLVLYNIFFKDYTKKVWGVDAACLSCEWGRQRIKKLSLFKTLLNSFISKLKFLKFAKETSLIDEFYYPKFGCSQLWNLMADYIKANGGEFIFESEFEDFNIENNKILSVKYKNKFNQVLELSADYFISSIPIKDLIKGIDAPFNIKQNALNLPYRDYILVSFYTNEFNLKNTTNFNTINNTAPDCWIYLQEKDAIASRIQIMNNWSCYLVPDFQNKYLISLEYFVFENDAIWTMSDDKIVDLASDECQKYGLFSKKSILKTKVIREKKAYPGYYSTYKNIDIIKEYLYTIKNLSLIGRNGLHKYNNMDEAMVCGINVARELIKKQD